MACWTYVWDGDDKGGLVSAGGSVLRFESCCDVPLYHRGGVVVVVSERIAEVLEFIF